MPPYLVIGIFVDKKLIHEIFFIFGGFFPIKFS